MKGNNHIRMIKEQEYKGDNKVLKPQRIFKEVWNESMNDEQKVTSYNYKNGNEWASKGM